MKKIKEQVEIYIFTHYNKIKKLRIIPYKIDYGAECIFLQVNSRKALKVFPRKNNAINSFNRQKKAAKKGLAPNVLSKKIVKVILPWSVIPYVIIDGNEDDLFSTYNLCDKKRSQFKSPLCFGYYTEIAQLFINDYEPYEESVDQLKKQLRKLFPRKTFYDISSSSANVGLLRGHVVCLDFGDLSSD